MELLRHFKECVRSMRSSDHQQDTLHEGMQTEETQHVAKLEIVSRIPNAYMTCICGGQKM